MATTPLKTASRALSFATLIVAGFATWLIGTQGLAPRERTEATPASERSIEFAAVTESAPTEPSPDAASKTSPRRRLDQDIARPATRPTFSDDPLFHDADEELTRLAESADNNRSTASQSPARIQPNLGRLSSRKPDPVTSDDIEELNMPAEEVVRPPQPPRTVSRSAAVLSPADVLHDAESSRVKSQLTSLQKKFDQFAQAQTEQKATDLQKAIETLEQIAESKYKDQYEKLRQQLEESKQNGTNPADALDPNGDKTRTGDPTLAAPLESADDETPAPKKSGKMHFEAAEGQRDRFDNIDFDDVDISKALAALGQLSGLNILVGRGVMGQVPAANLQNVTAEEALNAITKSLGYVYEREGNFVFVWTAADSMARKQAARKTVQKVFRPKYVSVKDLQMLVTPMLTKPGGLIAVTTQIGRAHV